jgi:hypothetical protein
MHPRRRPVKRLMHTTGVIVGTVATLDERFHDWLSREFLYRPPYARRVGIMPGRFCLVSTDICGDGTWMVRLRRVVKGGTEEGELWKMTADEFIHLLEGGVFREV